MVQIFTVEIEWLSYELCGNIQLEGVLISIGLISYSSCLWEILTSLREAYS